MSRLAEKPEEGRGGFGNTCIKLWLREPPVLQLTQRLWQKSQKLNSVLLNPKVSPTPAGFSHPLNPLHGSGSMVHSLPSGNLKPHRLQSDFAHLEGKTHPSQFKTGERGVKSRFHLQSTRGSHFFSTPHSPHHPPSTSFFSFFNTLPGLATHVFFFSSIETDITASLSQAPAPQTQPGPGQTQEKHRDMERNVQDTLRLPSTSDPSRYCSELLRKKAQSICPVSSVQEGNTILCPLLYSNSSSTYQIMT